MLGQAWAWKWGLRDEWDRPSRGEPGHGGAPEGGLLPEGRVLQLGGSRQGGRPQSGPHAEGDGEPLTAAEGERHVALVFAIRMQGSLWPLLPPQGVWIGGGRMIDEGASLIAAPA